MATELPVTAKTVTGFTIRTKDITGNGQDSEHMFSVFATNAPPPKGGTGADCWVSFDGTSSIGTDCTIRSSFNVSKVEHLAVGTRFTW